MILNLPVTTEKSNGNDITGCNQFFSLTFNGSILWNYKSGVTPATLTCNRLAKLAETKRWSIDTDITWHSVACHSQFPCLKHADPLCGFAAYDSLSSEERLDISWQRHGMEISEILHAEQLALMCASQLISLMPCMESRLFASMQAADEARHVGFFRRYIASLDMEVFQPSLPLRVLTVETLQNPHWQIKLLICQILIESLALAQFNFLLQTHPVPTLQQGLRRILDDEARHVKFGSEYLQSLFRHLKQDQREHYGHFVIDKAFDLASSDNHCLAIGELNQWNLHKLRHHLRQQRISKPQLIQQRFRQLSLNIKAIGLMNASLEQRINRFAGT